VKQNNTFTNNYKKGETEGTIITNAVQADTVVSYVYILVYTAAGTFPAS